jgi:hypothetical protein
MHFAGDCFGELRLHRDQREASPVDWVYLMFDVNHWGIECSLA